MRESSIEIVSKAADAVRDRGKSYGDPLDDMTRTAKIWEGILGQPITPEQVALCMIGVKLARATNAYKEDNMVDVAGYAMVYEDVASRATPEESGWKTDDWYMSDNRMMLFGRGACAGYSAFLRDYGHRRYLEVREDVSGRMCAAPILGVNDFRDVSSGEIDDLLFRLTHPN